MEKSNKIFRSVYVTFENQVKDYIDFSLDLPSQPAKYIELIGYGIHDLDPGGVIYQLNIPQIFDNPIICHSTNNNDFIRFSHGLINSVDQKTLNGSIRCNFTPRLISTDNQDITIVFYFVIHY